MGVGVRNEKGLNGSFVWNGTHRVMSEDDFKRAGEAVAAALPTTGDTEQGGFECLRGVLDILSSPARLVAPRTWSSGKDSFRGFAAWPGGWANETEARSDEGLTVSGLERDFKDGCRMAGLWKGALREAGGLGLDTTGWVLPPGAAKAGSWEVFEAGEAFNARPCEGWAIWMEDGGGWMDNRKAAAAKCSEARIFESLAAVTRTAKAAGFGPDGRRGPCALVRLELEPRSVHSRMEAEGVPLTGLDGAMAAREAEELERAMEEGLGASEWDGDEGAFSGWALWGALPREGGGCADGGFVNIRGGLGPLSGADLSPSPERAVSKRGWNLASWAVVGVVARPVSVDGRLGDAGARAVEVAIGEGRAMVDRMAGELAVRASPEARRAPPSSSI